MPEEQLSEARLTNRLLATIVVQQSRHLHGALPELVRLGMPRAEVTVVVGLPEERIEEILVEAEAMAGAPIGRPPAPG